MQSRFSPDFQLYNMVLKINHNVVISSPRLCHINPNKHSHLALDQKIHHLIQKVQAIDFVDRAIVQNAL